MTRTPVDPDDGPLGGSLSPTPDEGSQKHPDQQPMPPAFPPPPPPAPGYYPPPGGGFPSSAVPEAFPAPPPAGSYPPPAPGAFPPPPGYPPAYPPGPSYTGGYAGSAMMRPHRATTVLVLGALGLLLFPPLAFFAFFMGRGDLAAMDAGTMDSSGRSSTNIGRILGIVGMVVLGISLIGLASSRALLSV